MDKTPDEKLVDQDLANYKWLVKKHEGTSDSDKKNNSLGSARNSKIPPLRLVRPPFLMPTKKNVAPTKLQECKQNLDKSMHAYNMTKKEVVVKHNLPFSPAPEREKYFSALAGDGEKKVSSLKVSLKPGSRILASLQNPSVGTNTIMTITQEEEQILALIKSSGLTLGDVKKIRNETKDDNNNKNVTPNAEISKTEYNNMNREYLEKIRVALLQSGDKNKGVFPFLYYLSLDNHDCVNSLFCLSEKNEDVSSSSVSSRECIVKALKDTMMPDTLQKVRKLLRHHILDMAKPKAEPAETKKYKMRETQTDAYHAEDPDAKKAKYPQTSETRGRIAVKNEAVLKNVQWAASHHTATQHITSTTNTQPTASDLPMNNQIMCTTNNLNKGFGQSTTMNRMYTQKVAPSLEYMQNCDTVPQFWLQQSSMYPSQNPTVSQALDYRWNSHNRRVVSFPNTNWNTSQY